MAETGKGGGIPEGGFKDRRQLEAWLKGQPHVVAVAIAWRSAARVFPLLAGEKPDAVILPVLRAIAVSRFAANWPNHETELVKSAAFSAAKSSSSTSDSASSSNSATYAGAFSAVLSAASSADGSVLSATNASADSVLSATNSAGSSAGHAVWKQVTNDARLFEEQGVKALNEAPLWTLILDRPDFPMHAALSDDKSVDMRDWLRTQPSADWWQVWVDWFDDVLHGKSGLTRNRDIEFARLFGHPDAGVEITEDDWEAGPSVVNPKIRQVLDWFASLGPGDNGDADEKAVFEQVTGPYRYTVAGGKLRASPHSGDPLDAQLANDVLAELQQKANDFLEATSKSSNCAALVESAATKLQRTLQNWEQTPSPGQLLSGLRTLEANIQAFDSPDGRAELFPSAIAMMIDLRDSLHDMVSLYPVVQQMQANALALNIQNANVTQINIYLNETADAAVKSDEVDESAVIALNDGKDEIADATQVIETTSDERKRAAAVEERAQKTANRVLSMRNFSAAWLRAVQDGVIEGSKDGTKKVVSGGIVVGTSALGAKLFGAWIGLATFVSSFAPFAKKVEEVQSRDDDLTDV